MRARSRAVLNAFAVQIGEKAEIGYVDNFFLVFGAVDPCKIDVFRVRFGDIDIGIIAVEIEAALERHPLLRSVRQFHRTAAEPLELIAVDDDVRRHAEVAVL